MKLEFQLFDTLLEPCIVVKRSLQIVYCNETAAMLFGVSARKIIRSEMTLQSLVEFSVEIPGLNNIEEVNAPTPIKEVSFKAKIDQKIGKVQVSLQPLASKWDEGQEPLWILFVRDVTLEEKLQKKYQGELNQKEHIIKDLENAKLMLEDYSKNLESKVQERTREVLELNQTMKAMLDSLHQGFFIFNSKGICLPVSSKACLEAIEVDPAGKHLADVLRLVNSERESLADWLETLFGNLLPVEDAVTFGPTHYKHSEGKTIELNYYPLFSENKELAGIVVVATDTTSLVEARAELATERNNAKLVINIIKNRRQIQNFIDNCLRIITHLYAELTKPFSDRDASNLFRSLHTLKGGASSFGLVELAEHCHQAEALLKEIRDDSRYELLSTAVIKEKWINVEKLVQLIKSDFGRFIEWSEQVVGKNLSKERVLDITFYQFVKVINKMEDDLNREQVKQILIDEFLTVPIQDQIMSYQETINQVANILQKPMAPLEIESESIKIIPEYYQDLLNSMIHVFRNAVDHGIEPVQRRLELGKPEEGQIKVKIQLKGTILAIEIADDGSGIDPAVIRQKLKENEIDTSSESDESVIQQIFNPGFSTRNQVTSISGQGVGMDAVMNSVRELGGRAYVKSQINKGTTVMIEVPYVKKMGRLRNIAS